jgi:hypothetical protein
MKYLFNPYFLALVVVVFFSYYGAFRSVKALHYINQLSVQRLYMDSEHHDSFIKDIYNRYTYYDYFFSFKPLKSKYWFTEEEVNEYQLELVDKVVE